MSSRLRVMQVVNGKSSCRTCDHKMFFINFTELPFFLPYHSSIERAALLYMYSYAECTEWEIGKQMGLAGIWTTAKLNGVRRRTAIKSRNCKRVLFVLFLQISMEERGMNFCTKSTFIRLIDGCIPINH